MPGWLIKLKEQVELNLGLSFNACILNRYSTCEDHINWHKDDERFLQHKTVASISLGAIRDFKVKIGVDEIVNQVPLRPGSLAVLYNGIEHALPKRSGKNAPVGPRYNITFRSVKTEEALKGSASGFGNYFMYCRGEKYEIKNK
jgi:alkylated DNA repair dioxygenase AlkB